LGLIRKMPRLEELELYAEGLRSKELFALSSLTRLRSLKWYQTSQALRLDVLAGNASFGQLRELRFHPHHIEEFVYPSDLADGFSEGESYLPLRVVRPFLHSPHFPNLTRLQLRLSSLGDEGCREIVASGILRRLKVLDLRHGRVTDAGARLL